MGKRNWFAHTAQSLVALAGCTLAASASALYVEMFAIGDFVPGSSGGCGGNDISDWPGMAQAWYDEMGALGHYKAGKRVDGNMTIRRFCDNTTYSGSCLDYSSIEPGVDWADAAIVAYHGSDNGDHWFGTQRYPWNSACAVEAGGTSNMVHFGDKWLMFFHTSSCFSMDNNNLGNARNAMVKSGASRRSHQWDGFHGIMWISSSFNGNYSNFAFDGHVHGIAYAWVTNHYKKGQFNCAWYDPWNWFGTCLDQCPVGYSIGTSSADALNRLNWERYNNVFSDPSGDSWWAYMYYPGCHPVGKGPF